MIYLTGDTHGNLDIQRVVDFFESEILLQSLTKEDYLIILGDAGICWDDAESDEFVLNILKGLPVTTLFIDGNHENFALLNSYPISSWHGGKVHKISNDVIHLMRGQVFEIENKKFFTFGGGNSIDKMYRTENYSWWKEEMPLKAEYDEGLIKLENNNFEVDYILTHTVPVSIFNKIMAEKGLRAISGEEQLQNYLELVLEKTSFKSWWFGHFHFDMEFDKFFGLYNDVVRLI